MYSFQKYFEETFGGDDEFLHARQAGFYEQLAKIMYQKLTPKRRKEIDELYRR